MISRFWNFSTALQVTRGARRRHHAGRPRSPPSIVTTGKLLMIAMLCVIPLLLVFKAPSAAGDGDHTMVVE